MPRIIDYDEDTTPADTDVLLAQSADGLTDKRVPFSVLARIDGADFTGPVSHAGGVTITDDDGTTLINGLRSLLALTPPTADDEVGCIVFKIPDGSWGIGQDYSEGNILVALNDADGSATVAGVPLLKTISATTNATPVVITTSATHGYTTGDVVRISGTTVSALNKWWKIVVLSTTTFSLNDSTAPGSTSAVGNAFTDRNPVVLRIADTGPGYSGGIHLAAGLRGRSGQALGTTAMSIDLCADLHGLTVSSPGTSYWGPTPTGHYIQAVDSRAANAVRFAVNAAGQTLFDAGTAAAPGLAIVGNTNTGFYGDSANVIGVAAEGVEVANIHANGITVIPGSAGGQSRIGTIAGFAAVALGSAEDTYIARLNAGVVQVGTCFDIPEMAEPAAPAANMVRFFGKDNGSGKTQLMAKFNTGSAVQVAIQP